MSQTISRTTQLKRTALTAMTTLALALGSLSASADYFEEKPNCRAPQKPAEFLSDVDKGAFDKKVKEYRTCLEDFVKKQNKAIKNHHSAAEKAAAMWKDYAINTLGMKEEPIETAPEAGATATK